MGPAHRAKCPTSKTGAISPAAMTMDEPQPWEKLFSPPGPGDSRRSFHMRLVRRGGHPFLLLPNSSQLAVKGIDLYAPQTRSASWAKNALSVGLRHGLLALLKKTSLNVAVEDLFAAYLCRQAGTDEAQFALLLGNPNTLWQRCIFMFFNYQGDPAGVVKAGAGPDATALISHEETFLKRVPILPGIPRMRSFFESERTRALAFDFLPAAARPQQDWDSAANLLTAWVSSNITVTLEDLSIWNRLLVAGGRELPPTVKEIETVRLSPAIFHGDFAPWNIRVKNGSWILVDWERAEVSGPPLWDWLHFVIQPAILVERAAPEIIVQRLQRLFQFPRFLEYANHAKIQGLEWRLVEAYLQYCLHVLRQTEGLNRVRALAESARLKEMLG